MKRSWSALAALAVVAAAGCGGSDDSIDTSVTLDVDVTTSIDLLEGAFQRNAGSQTEPGASTTAAGDTTVAPPAETAPVTTAPAETAPGASTTTVVGADVTPTTLAGGSTTAPPTGTAPATPQARQGVAQIGAVSYPFATDACDVADGDLFVLGAGTSSAGETFDVTIVYELFDFDGDGSDEVSFDIAIDPSGSGDPATSAEYYASKVDSGDEDAEGEDIMVSFDGSRLTASGPIMDLNGVVIPIGSTLPMTLDVRCS